MSGRTYFTPALFRFLKELKKNNKREWFQANKERYEKDVREPMLDFVSDFGPHLEKISSAFVADPRKSGGSLFRIHRDVRFARDKSPYKTFVGAQFRHEAGKDAHAPCFYLHLEPGSSFAAAGLWHPDGPSLLKIREAIVETPADWKKLMAGRVFRDPFSLGGESLKRPPRGFDQDHPLIEDLKRKDFIASALLTESEICSAKIMADFTRKCRSTAPFVSFLTKALDLPF